MVGQAHARRILTRFGYYWGQADAAAMRRVFEWDNLVELIKAGPRLHTLQGVNRTIIRELEVDEQGTIFLAEMEHAYIQAVLKSLNGNQTQAARVLGIGPSTLWRKLKQSQSDPN